MVQDLKIVKSAVPHPDITQLSFETDASFVSICLVRSDVCSLLHFVSRSL